MDYIGLATELMSNMVTLRKAKLHRNIRESLQGEAFVLRFISQQGKEVLPGEISAEMDVSSARIAAALNRLEEKKLVTRQINAADRRKILVSLTNEGRQMAEKHQGKVTKAAANMLELLGEDDAREYVRITGKLAEIISKL